MDRQKIIASLGESKEDQVLLARVWDKITMGERKNIPAASCFLTGREQILCQRMLRQAGIPEPLFFGGTEGAERRVAVYVPDYLDQTDYLYGEEGPVTALRVRYSAYDTLSHRDFLGSLMGQGIKREILGDLFPGAGSCDILVLREMGEYLVRQLTHVGRATVQAEIIALSALEIPEQKVKRVTDTVASLRLDSIVASGFQQGRGKAVGYIQAGKVELNHLPVEKPDAAVEEGDLISLRGLGKLRVAQVKGQTKKGRIAVVLERFL